MSTSVEQEEEVLLLDEIAESLKVVLFNDDVNTFDWVIHCLVEICDHDAIQAEQCATLVHFKGKAAVKSGPADEMTNICTALCDRGLSAVVE